jgi:hypothetical protein
MRTCARQRRGAVLLGIGGEEQGIARLHARHFRQFRQRFGREEFGDRTFAVSAVDFFEYDIAEARRALLGLGPAVQLVEPRARLLARTRRRNGAHRLALEGLEGRHLALEHRPTSAMTIGLRRSGLSTPYFSIDSS